MGNLADKVRAWWWSSGSPSAPFEVSCVCGQEVRGQREVKHQSVRCPACQRGVFVLPISPLPPPRSTLWSGRRRLGPALAAAGPSQAAPSRPNSWPFWRWPLLAAALTLVLVSISLIILFQFVGQRPPPTLLGGEADPLALVREGESALVEGQFQLATDRLRQGLAALEKSAAQPLPAREVRRLALLAQQTHLLADLLSEPLGDIVHLAMVDEKQWPDQFARRYKGRGVVFDAEVRREMAGQYRLGYHVQAGGHAVRIEVGDLHLLEALPLEKPTRLLFGARLAGVGREAGGVWVVRFEPDSGVLLTDERAVTASCPPPFDEQMKELLERQADWALGLP